MRVELAFVANSSVKMIYHAVVFQHPPVGNDIQLQGPRTANQSGRDSPPRLRVV